VIVAGLDGTMRRTIATGIAESSPVSPRWSPDGHAVAFSGTGRGGGEIRIVDLDSGDGRVVAHGWAPRWSPDGRWLAYLRIALVDGVGRGAVFVASRDGSEHRRIGVFEKPEDFD
jgi:Tol biopolymer transport system component